jgi:hypothetical protein
MPDPVVEPYPPLQTLPPSTGTFAERVGGLPTEAQILAHGFDFRPDWWETRIRNPAWTGFFHTLKPTPEKAGYRRITRRDLLTLPVFASGPSGYGALLAGCYAWGTGPQPWLVPRRALVYTRRDRVPHPLIEKRLAAAVDAMRHGTPEDGYRLLLRTRQAARVADSAAGRIAEHGPIKSLGPSFYTKVLHTADADRNTGRPGRALILDQFVVIGLNHLEGWGLREMLAWSPETYTRWLAYAHKQAAEPDLPGGPPMRIDAIERAVFRLGRFIYDQRRPPRRGRRA